MAKSGNADEVRHPCKIVGSVELYVDVGAKMERQFSASCWKLVETSLNCMEESRHLEWSSSDL